MGTLRRAMTGLAAGAAATIPMTGVFVLARRSRLIDELPPHKAIRSVASRLPEPALSRWSLLAHLAVGGIAGAIYSALLPRRAHGPLSGLAFGIGVWATGYEVVMPAATEMPPAHRDQRRRVVTIVLAHIVYGLLLGIFAARCTSLRSNR